MFSHQMKLISVHPVGPASSFNFSLLHTHQLVSLPGDGGLHVSRVRREYGIIINFNNANVSSHETMHTMSGRLSNPPPPLKNNYSDIIYTYGPTWPLSQSPSKQLIAYL